MKYIISQIVATSKNRVIGRKNKLPWRMPSDAHYFHDVTRGHPVIMGRKNYEANKRALPGRPNIVITRKKDFNPADAHVVDTIENAIENAKQLIEKGNFQSNEIFIVGGGEIYRQTLDISDKIYLTIIDFIAEGDTFYPEIDFSDYTILSKDFHSADAKNPHNWTYYVLGRK